MRTMSRSCFRIKSLSIPIRVSFRIPFMFTLAIIIKCMCSACEGEGNWSYFTFSLYMALAEVGCMICPVGCIPRLSTLSFLIRFGIVSVSSRDLLSSLVCDSSISEPISLSVWPFGSPCPLGVGRVFSSRSFYAVCLRPVEWGGLSVCLLSPYCLVSLVRSLWGFQNWGAGCCLVRTHMGSVGACGLCVFCFVISVLYT